MEAGKDKARGRWRLLRQAVVNRAVVAEPREEAVSIHAFGGFNLLESRRLRLDEDAEFLRRMVDALCRLKCPSEGWTPEALAREIRASVAATAALRSSERGAGEDEVLLDVTVSPALPGDMMLDVPGLESSVNGALETEEEEHGAAARCQVLTAEAVRIRLAAPARSGYCVHEYFAAGEGGGDDEDHREDPPIRVLARQKTGRTVRLKDLVSHHHHGGVDNTGNVCVWDSEKTLAWALLREASEATAVDVVNEVGAGMAGLGGLALAAGGGVRSRVRLTDGHASCVFNNQVSLRLTAAFHTIRTGRPLGPAVECQQLLWSCSSLEDNDPNHFVPGADWTLASDCTHFEDRHGDLLWTLVAGARPGGRIWLCQPRRGRSLERFLALAELVNERAAMPLVRIHERLYRAIEQKHRAFLSSSASYNPDVHKPLVFVLEKLRDASEADRTLIQDCVNERTPRVRSGGR